MSPKTTTRRKKVQPTRIALATASPADTSVPAASPNLYSLELVVSTAAKLLSGGNHAEAARSALALIDACREQMEEYQEARQPRLNFSEAVQRITGETDQARARKLFERYLHDKWLHYLRVFGPNRERRPRTADEILVPEPAAAEDPEALAQARFMLAEYEREGVAPRRAEDLRELFGGWRAKKRSVSASERGSKGAAARKAKAEAKAKKRLVLANNLRSEAN